MSGDDGAEAEAEAKRQLDIHNELIKFLLATMSLVKKASACAQQSQNLMVPGMVGMIGLMLQESLKATQIAIKIDRETIETARATRACYGATERHWMSYTMAKMADTKTEAGEIDEHDIDLDASKAIEFL